MNLRTLKITTWLMSLLFAASFSFGSFGDVLCINGDGHAKVESICQQTCDEAEDLCSISSSKSEHEHNDDCGECDDCYDLPLDKQAWLRHNSKSDYDTNHIFTFPVPSIHHSLDLNKLNKSVSTHKHFIPIYNQSTALITTTVILC